MKKKVLFAAMALVALASCTSDEIVSLSSPPEPAPTDPEISGAIVFSSASKGTTRADIKGADAADLLGKAFVVSGYKGSATASPGSIVFDNYLVEWSENTAHTTESNTTNWEYVGKGRIKHAIDNGITSQTIKYWDYIQPQYDFIAWSTGKKEAIYEGTPGANQVLVSAITPATATGTGDGKVAYTFTGKAADLSQCYIADLVTVKKADYGDNPVTFSFRQLGTKVRIGIYETVPGYSVKGVKFYSAAASDDADPLKARLFTTVENDIYTEGTYTVFFPTVDDPSDADNNQAHVTFAGSGTQKTIVDDWGGLNYTIAEEGEKTTGNVFLGRTSNTASFAGDAEKNYYEIFLPNQTGTNLNLRVDYTLESTDGSGEVINVRGATAQVPLIYAQWKPGFAYTYLFKISDKTNGYTGEYNPLYPDDVTINSEPAGLYPITFDAVVVDAEEDDKTQETITLVATPSITTYQKGSTVVNDNEYKASTGDIFVTVNDGGGYVEVTGLTPDVSSVSDYYTFNTTTGIYTKCGPSDKAAENTKYYRLDPVLANGALQDLTGKAALYILSEDKTEADVIDALQMRDDDNNGYTIKGRSGLGLSEASFTLTNKVEYGVDGNTIDLTDGTKKKAMQFSATSVTYAFVYTKTAPTIYTDKFQPVTKADGASVNGLYRYALTAAPAGDMQKDVKYFPNENASAGMITAFLGQGVGNMYTRSGAGTDADPYVFTIASGYAKTGTTYYYTTNNGMNYTAAHSLAYADFASTTLYKDRACTETFTSEEKANGPENGTAYYYKDGSDNKYYCIILPQQTTGYFVIDESAAKVGCGSTNTAVKGMTYFDKYIQNNGVYYTKVIKVQ